LLPCPAHRRLATMLCAPCLPRPRTLAPTAPRWSRPSGCKNAHRGLAVSCRTTSAATRSQAPSASGKTLRCVRTARRTPLLPQGSNNSAAADSGSPGRPQGSQSDPSGVECGASCTVTVCSGCAPHYYTVNVPLCFCSQADAFNAFRNFSAPGAPYAQDGTHKVVLPGFTSGNPIKQTVDPNAMTITNETLPGHLFGGQVVISFSTENSVTSVNIVGSGIGPNAELNQILGPEIFTGLAMGAFYYLNPGMSGGSL
jgi:hypothetical protein